MYSPSTDGTWLSAVVRHRKLLLRMRDWSRQERIDFGLVIFPSPIQILPGKDLRDAAMQAFGLGDLDYPTQRIARFAAHNGIPHLDLLDPLRAYGDRERDFSTAFPLVSVTATSPQPATRSAAN